VLTSFEAHGEGLQLIDKTRSSHIAFPAAVLGFLLAAGAGFAQQNTKPAQPAKPVQAPTSTGSLQRQQAPSGQISAVKLNLLIRNTLIALNQANQSGNYSVLRDLGSPAFQRFNSAAALAEKFSALRKAKVDLTPIFYFHPQLTKQPALQDGRFLRLIGHMPTKPQQINFDLAYQNVDGQWLLVAIAVGVSQTKPKVSSNGTEAKPAQGTAAAKNLAPAKKPGATPPSNR
jgi:hypothetical protein